jgi:hypothetical protein
MAVLLEDGFGTNDFYAQTKLAMGNFLINSSET